MNRLNPEYSWELFESEYMDKYIYRTLHVVGVRINKNNNDINVLYEVGKDESRIDYLKKGFTQEFEVGKSGYFELLGFKERDPTKEELYIHKKSLRNI